MTVSSSARLLPKGSLVTGSPLGVFLRFSSCCIGCCVLSCFPSSCHSVCPVAGNLSPSLSRNFSFVFLSCNPMVPLCHTLSRPKFPMCHTYLHAFPSPRLTLSIFSPFSTPKSLSSSVACWAGAHRLYVWCLAVVFVVYSSVVAYALCALTVPRRRLRSLYPSQLAVLDHPSLS